MSTSTLYYRVLYLVLQSTTPYHKGKLRVQSIPSDVVQSRTASQPAGQPATQCGRPAGRHGFGRLACDEIAPKLWVLHSKFRMFQKNIYQKRSYVWLPECKSYTSLTSIYEEFMHTRKCTSTISLLRSQPTEVSSLVDMGFSRDQVEPEVPNRKTTWEVTGGSSPRTDRGGWWIQGELIHIAHEK